MMAVSEIKTWWLGDGGILLSARFSCIPFYNIVMETAFIRITAKPLIDRSPVLKR